MSLPVPGVGLTFFSGLEPLVAGGDGLVDLIEVEPQTLWYRTGSEEEPYRLDARAVQGIAALPGTKLLHGVGFPVGGTLPPDARQIPPLREMLAAFGAPWMSEHLSFNRVAAPGGAFTTAFLLPPRQSADGVRAAVRSIRAMADALPVPLAVETGVSYLRPRRDEIEDGAFVARVVEGADCGLLLDLHNLWTNERNGRQRVDDYLDQLPLERVWEVHLAGGHEHQGYWLDAHSGAVPVPLLQLAERVVPRLPALRALIFELFPRYLEDVGIDGIRAQLVALRRLWERRAAASRSARRAPPPRPPARSDGPSAAEWECALGTLAVGGEGEGPLARELSADPGIAVMRGLIGEFRASMVVGTLPLTVRYLWLCEGRERVDALLADYWRRAPPELFASREAEGFGRFLRTAGLGLPYLEAVLGFELATMATLLDERPHVVAFPVDPIPLLRALGERRLPDPALLSPGRFEIEVTPDSADADARRSQTLQVLH